MGQKYSVKGYLNATLRRSNKTLLVEGITDKQILHRLALERHPTTVENITIDYADMLDDPAISGLGKKQVIAQVQLAAHGIKEKIPKIEDVLATLIDREWDDIEFRSPLLRMKWQQPAQGLNRFVTLGHSIENYHFNVDCAIDYLKYAFPEPISNSSKVLSALRERFPAIIVFAIILSLVMREDECLVKSDALIDTSHLAYKNNRYYLAQPFAEACANRRIINAETVANRVNDAIDAAWDALCLEPTIHWLPHGHLGNDVIWACVGHMAAEFGVSPQIAHEIAHGRKKDRNQFFADWLSKLPRESKAPLDSALDWLYSV